MSLWNDLRQWLVSLDRRSRSYSGAFDQQLPTLHDDITVAARIAVRWVQPRRTPWEFGRDECHQYCTSIAKQWSSSTSAADLPHLQKRLIRELDGEILLNDGTIRMTVPSVVLDADAASMRKARHRDEVERKLADQDAEQQIEMARLRYLRDEVLSDPGMARSYWFAHHPDELDTLLDRKFEEVPLRMTRGDRVEQDLRIAQIIGKFVEGLRPADRQHLLGQVAQVFDQFDQPELAEDLVEQASNLGTSRNGTAGDR